MPSHDKGLFEEVEEEEPYTPSGYDGERSYTPEVAIPIWEDAASYGGETYRLRIQRMNMDGTRSDLGHIAGDSSEAALVNQWAEAGTYLIMPVDEHGRSLRDQPYRRTIAHDHLLLKRKRAEMGASGNGAQTQGIDPYILMMQQTIADLRAQHAEEKREAAEERAEERRAVAEVRAEEKQRAQAVEQRALALTIEQNATSAEMTQSLLQTQQDNFAQSMALQEQRTQQFMLSMQSISAANIEAGRRQREQEREAHQQAIERDRDRARRDEEDRQRNHERVMEREAGRRESEIAGIRANQEYQQRMWEEQSKRAEENARRDRDRDQQYMDRQLEAAKEQKNPLEVVGNLIKPFGYTVADLLPLITGSGQKTMIETLANTAAEVVKAAVAGGGLQGLVAQAQGQLGPEEGEEEEQYIPVQVASGQIAMVPRSALTEIPPEAAEQAMQPQQPQQPQQAHPPSNYIDGSTVFGKPGTPPFVAPTEPVIIETSAVPAVVKPTVPIKIAKPARKAIRMLIGELSGCAQDEWITKIVAMVTDTPESLEYLKIVTVRGALSEAGASDEMAAAIITNLDNPEFKPFTEGIPRG